MAADKEKQKDAEQERKEWGREVGRKELRKLKSRLSGNKNIWFGLGMFGIVGWSVAIPTLIGVAIGVWLDSKYTGKISWTLTGLFVGLCIGCLNAWLWIKKESERE